MVSFCDWNFTDFESLSIKKIIVNISQVFYSDVYLKKFQVQHCPFRHTICFLLYFKIKFLLAFPIIFVYMLQSSRVVVVVSVVRYPGGVFTHCPVSSFVSPAGRVEEFTFSQWHDAVLNPLRGTVTLVTMHN